MPYVIATAKPDVWNKAVEGIDVRPDAKLPAKTAALATALNAPRVGIYQSYDPSMDEGWTRWVLDHYHFEYTSCTMTTSRPGNLRQRFDAIILPDQRGSAILERPRLQDHRPDSTAAGSARPGWDALRQFVADGGTLVSLGEASNFVLDKFPLGVKDLKRTTHARSHFAPGTIVNLQVDTANPVGRGHGAGDVGLLHQLAVLPVDRRLLVAESQRGGALSQYRGERLADGCAAKT